VANNTWGWGLRIPSGQVVDLWNPIACGRCRPLVNFISTTFVDVRTYVVLAFDYSSPGTHTTTHTRTHTDTHTHARAHIHTHTYARARTRTRTHTLKHTHSHAHTHTCTHARAREGKLIHYILCAFIIQCSFLFIFLLFSPLVTSQNAVIH
jgi:ABC-type nickel/cobalt efflux system permease component RcnA